MNGLIMSMVAAAVIAGSVIYIKESNIQIANQYRQAKSIVAYTKKASALNTLSNAKIGVNPAVLLVGSSQDKKLERKLTLAMKKALKTNPNPTCGDLAKTGEISYTECMKAFSMKNAFIKINNGVIDVNTTNTQASSKIKPVEKIIKAEVAPNSYYKKTLIEEQTPTIVPVESVSKVMARKIAKINRIYIKTIKEDLKDSNLKVNQNVNNIIASRINKIMNMKQRMMNKMLEIASIFNRNRFNNFDNNRINQGFFKQKEHEMFNNFRQRMDMFRYNPNNAVNSNNLNNAVNSKFNNNEDKNSKSFFPPMGRMKNLF